MEEIFSLSWYISRSARPSALSISVLVSVGCHLHLAFPCVKPISFSRIFFFFCGVVIIAFLGEVIVYVFFIRSTPLDLSVLDNI